MRDRVTIQEAASRLGISESGVRKRVQREQIPHERDENGRVFIYLDSVETERDEVRDSVRDSVRDRYIESLEEQITYLRSQLDGRQEEIRRKDHIIAGLVERIPPQLEAPQEPQNQTESAEPRSDRDTGPGEAAGPERRSWWQRWFGG